MRKGDYNPKVLKLWGVFSIRYTCYSDEMLKAKTPQIPPHICTILIQMKMFSIAKFVNIHTYRHTEEVFNAITSHFI